MLKSIPFILCTALSFMGSTAAGRETITVHVDRKGAPVSPSMYGVFFEEINHAGDGGLYAELVRNRSFEEKEMPAGYHAEGNKLIPRPVCYHLDGKVRDRSFRWTEEDVPGWTLTVSHPGAASMAVTKDNPRYASAPNNLRVDVKNAAVPVTLVNDGYWGMNFNAGEQYLLRTILRTSPSYKGKVSVRLSDEKGKVLAETPLALTSDGKWCDLSATLIPSGSDNKGRLALVFDSPGSVWIDYVSLFPENTYNKRPNGLRRDVAGMIADLKPAFFRWPGGCVVEGITLDNRFEWKKTLGDPASRPGEYSTWGYRCSYGFGYHEMLQFCEDMGAKAMYVCNVGLGCQFRMGDASPREDIGYYLDDCMDAIEYALGDASTEWGRKRIEAGHPEPFPLGYVEIGNENWGPEYDSRFDIFYNAIKSKYPQLQLIYNEMPQREGPARIARTDLIDPHWYVDPYFFFRNADMYDKYKRGKHNIYVGEYAVNRGVGGGNMFGALAEAAFIGGMERNGDLVTMASYAPLFENRHDRSWETNLIWIDTDTVMGRSSYYVQRMAAENRPTYNLKSSLTHSAAEPEYFERGRIGFGAANADVEFSDIRVRYADGKVLKLGDKKLNRQNMVPDLTPEANDYVLTCRVRKNGGSQGFQFYVGMDPEGATGYRYNVGMWSSNDRAELTRLDGGRHRGILAEYQKDAIETGKWYDVRIDVKRDGSSLYIDGEKILDYASKPMPLQFVNTGYDVAAGEVVIKVVNAASEPYATRFVLEGADKVRPEGKVISLTANSEKEENDFNNPRRIYPKNSLHKEFGREFDYDFPSFSYTVLRIKTDIGKK